MSISAADVGKLRKMTGVGMMEAKKALEEVGGDFDKAIEELRKRGAAKAAKKADRETSEGRVHTYTHTTGKIGVMVKVVCETDFVAKNDDFVAFCNDLAMHAAAMAPDYLKREDVPEDVVAKEREILAEQLKAEGKPEDMLDKMLGAKRLKVPGIFANPYKTGGDFHLVGNGYNNPTLAASIELGDNQSAEFCCLVELPCLCECI